MNTPKTEVEARRYHDDLMKDIDSALQEIANRPSSEALPEFKDHECWKTLFVFPHKDFPEEPGEVVCQGCERRWRLVEEHRP